MKIALIVAVAEDGTIGHGGTIPWHISADLKRFKKLTMGHVVIMGRRTYESIGKPLAGRRNLVLTRNPSFQAPAGVMAFSSLNAALDFCRRQHESIAFIIGGAEAYRRGLQLADMLFLTRVNRPFNGDTRFPDFDRAQWLEVSRQQVEECWFIDYRRNEVPTR